MKGRFGWLLIIWVYKINDRGAYNIDSVSCVCAYFKLHGLNLHRSLS